MKTWINTIIKFWWFIQGIILLVFGFLAWIPLSVTGIIVIICDYFYDHRNSTIRMYSRIMLMIYALVYMMEKAREIDPFGHAGFDPSGKIRLTL